MAERSLTFSIRARSKQFSETMGRVRKTLKRVTTGAAKFGKSLGKIGVALGAVGVAVGAVVALLVRLGSSFASRTQEAVRFAAGIGDVSKQTGMSVRNVQRWRQTLRAAGQEADDLSDLSAELSERIALFGQLEEGPTRAFRALGLTFAELREMNPSHQLETVIEALGKVQDAGRRINIAREILGDQEARTALTLIGRDLAELQEGELLSEDEVKKARELRGVFASISGTFQRAFAKAAAANFDSLKVAAEQLLQAFQDKEFMNSLKSSIKSLADIIASPAFRDMIVSLTKVLRSLLSFIRNRVEGAKSAPGVAAEAARDVAGFSPAGLGARLSGNVGGAIQAQAQQFATAGLLRIGTQLVSEVQALRNGEE